MAKVERYYRWVSVFNHDLKKNLYSQDFVEQVADNDSINVVGKWFNKSNGNGILDTTLLTDQMTYLPNDLLVKVYIASMANSLEARSPFLDHKVIEFAASLPENIKMKRFETKSLLKRVAAKLVPKEVIYRRKMGFGVPIGDWFRGEMKDFVKEILLSETFAKRGIAKPDVVAKYVAEHLKSERDHTYQIWTLLMLELWFQEFID